jgi:asparagine synthase (glutamine-hydrolysing)
MDYVLGHVTGPYPGANLYITVNLYRMAHATGTRVLFEGFDGDNVVSHGLGYFRELKNTRQWIKLIMEVRAFSLMKGEPLRATVWSWIKGPVKQSLGIVAAKRIAKRVLGYPDTNRTPAPPQWHGSLNPAFAEALGPDLADPIKHATERENHIDLLTQTILPQSIREVLDPLAADKSIDIRYPFFDKELVEFCLSLPVDQKIRRGWTRRVMRNAMEGVLPDSVRLRKAKSNYEPTFERSLFTFERERLEAIASGNFDSIAPYVDTTNLAANTKRYLARESVGLFDRVFIWKALSLALWLKYPGSYRSENKVEPKEVMPATAL